MPFLKNKKMWVFLIGAAIGALFLISIISLVGFGAYYLGRYHERRDMAQQIFSMSQQRASSTENSPGEPPSVARNFKATKGTSQKSVAQSKSAGKITPPSPQNVQDLENLLSGGGEGGVPSLESLEAMLGKMAPMGGESGPPEISKEAIAAVKVGKDDSASAVRSYFKTVEKLMSAGNEISPQKLIGEVKAGDTTSLDKATGDLQKSFQKMQQLEVPPRCRELHAYYLALIPDLMSVIQSQKKGTEGDASELIQGMMKVQHIVSMQKQIKKLETQIASSL